MPAPIASPESLAESGVLIGHAAGLAASAFWVATSIFFAEAGRRIGSTAVNSFRLVVAVALHAATYAAVSAMNGRLDLWPDVTTAQLLWLAGSGLVGLTICDQCLFTAFVDIGPRRSLLCMTTSPLVALALGTVFLDEAITLADALGMALTLGGVAWVILERDPTLADKQQHPHFRRGVVLALIGAATQAAGLFMSKKGIGHGLVPADQHVGVQAATYIRMVFGALGMVPWIAFYAARRGSAAHASSKARRVGKPGAGYALTAAGAVVGPYFGVWASLIAGDRLPVGIAQTLLSLSPVMILPFAVFVQKEHVSARGVAGACLAVAGTAVLALLD
ncbi:MAG: DMT family transporter [Planctomycetota bacterium]